MTKLTPTTHIIHTAINSGMSQVDAVAEFVDNAFGVSAGDASVIQVCEFSDQIMFLDNGNGVSDINMMFQLGASNSQHSTDDIGRFGVGSKYGALTYGSLVTVETIYKGRYHSYSVDWADVMESGVWPDAYDSIGLPVDEAPDYLKGTAIFIQNLHEGRARTTHKTLAKALALKFSPWLEMGKKLFLMNAKGRSKVHIEQLIKAGKFIDVNEYRKGLIKLSYERSETLSIGGKSMTVRAGALRAYDPQLSGVHISFGGRVIQRLNQLGDESLPNRYYAEVALSTSWKEHLNFNKTCVVNHMVPLMRAILNYTRELIDEITEHQEEVRLELISERISMALTNSVNEVWKGKHKAIPGESKVKGNGGGGKNDNDASKKTAGDMDVDDAQEGENDNRGKDNLAFKMSLSDKLGDEAFKVDLNLKASVIHIILNKNNQVLSEAMKAPMNMGAIYTVLVTAVVNKFISEEYSYLAQFDDIRERGDHTIQFTALFSELLSSVPAVKEPTKKEIDAA